MSEDHHKYRGVIDVRRHHYTRSERRHLIGSLARWGGNLYIFGQLEWEGSITPLSAVDAAEFETVASQCEQHGLPLWAWMKPGDVRYAFHASDRRTFVENALRYMSLGAKGFYLLMDDLHPGLRVSVDDAEKHGALIEELAAALGEGFKGICAEHYHGAILSDHAEYWQHLTRALPKHVMITWTGPGVWNARMVPEDVPSLDWPLLLWDNYFTSDSEDPARSPIYPYDGRHPHLGDHLSGVLIHPNLHYGWQYCALKTAMDFWRDPMSYRPDESFRAAVREMGDELQQALVDRPS